MVDDRGVEADDVIAAVDEVLPPGLLDVVLQFDAEGAVIEEAVEAAVEAVVEAAEAARSRRSGACTWLKEAVSVTAKSGTCACPSKSASWLV